MKNMKVAGLLRQLVVGILVCMAMLSPALVATIPTSPVSAQSTLNGVEKAADTSLALGNVFRNCSVISQDGSYLANQNTLTGCIKEVVGLVFVIAVLWVIITLAATMLGTVLRSGEGKGDGPIKATRKKLENSLIGLFLLGGPYLLLSLFSPNLGNTDLLYSGVDNGLIKSCFSMRKMWEENKPQQEIEAYFTTNITTPYLTKVKAKTPKRIVETLSGPIGEYELNSKYILSDFCVTKIPLATFQNTLIKKAQSAYVIDRNRAQLASFSRFRAKLAAITVTPAPKDVDQLQASINDVYTNCIRDLPDLALYCAFVRTGAEVSGYAPDDQPESVIERNRWVIFLGRLYQVGYADDQLGGAVADAIILSIERGSLDKESTKVAVGVASSLISDDVYKKISDPYVRDLHLQRLAYVSQAVTKLIDNPQVDGTIAAYAVGFASTFVLTAAPQNDTDRSFVALKTAVVQNMMQLLINNQYDTRTVVNASFTTLAQSLRAFGNNIEAEMVSAVGYEANQFMIKLEQESAGTYKVTQYDYYEAALDIGLYAVDIAVRTKQDLDPDGRLSNIVRISGQFGKDVVQGETRCAQDLFQIDKLVQSAKLYKVAIDSQSNDTAVIEEAITKYNQGIDQLRILFATLTNKDAYGEPGAETLIDIMGNQEIIRLGLLSCKGVESSRLLRLSVDLAKAALPSTTPAIVGGGIDFVYNSITTLSDPNISKPLQQDYIALGLVDLASQAVAYIPSDNNNAQVAGAVITGTLSITRSYLNTSIECKTALETLKNTTQTTKIQYDWSTIYERYVRGQSSEDDLRIFKATAQTESCLGLKNSQIVESGLNTIRNVYVIASQGNTDPRIADLIDPSRNDSVSYFVISTLKDVETNNLYPQNIAINFVRVGAYVIKNFGDTSNPRLATAVDSVSGQVVSLLGVSLERQKNCDAAKKANLDSADCKGLNEFDFTRSFLAVLKEVVEIQGPGQQFFDTTLSVANTYIDELQKDGISDSEAALGLLDLARSGTEVIFADLSNKPDLTQGDKDRLAFGRSLSGKAFGIARKYFVGREGCDASVVDVQFRIRGNITIVNSSLLPSVYDKAYLAPTVSGTITTPPSEITVVSRSIGYTLGQKELGNTEFSFSNSDVSGLEKTLLACQNTVSLDSARAIVDIVAEFVKIPGFPMQEAAGLADYLVNTAFGIEQYSEYRTGQYAMRLLAAVIQQNACTPKEGETFSVDQTRGCAAVAKTFGFVDRVIQLYIDGKATNPNFARELLYLGHNLATTFGAEEFTASQVDKLGGNLIALWEKSINGETNIFNEKTVAAEFLNFAGAMLPHVLKTGTYTTGLIQTWTQVAATALTAPDSVNASTAIRATAAFVASKIWQCDTPNGRPNQSAECDANVGADVSVFMGVLDSVNIGPVSKEKYVNLCYDAVNNDVCGPQIDKQIVAMQDGIGSGNENAYRQANSYLYYQDPNNAGSYIDLRVKPAELGGAGFRFSQGSGSQYETLKKKVNVCESVGVPNAQTSQTQGDAAANDPTVSKFKDKTDFTEIPNNQCLRNPMIQLTSVLSLDLDKLVDSVLYGLSNAYGSIGIGENKIVATLSKVLIEMDFNRVAAGDTSTISRTLVKNIGYVLRSLPIEQLTGDSAAKVIRMVGDMPWETLIYNPLALGGPECAPPAKTLQQASASGGQLYFSTRGVSLGGRYLGTSQQYYSDFTPDTVIGKPIQATRAITVVPTDVGVDKPSSAGLTPACTASLVTGILSRIDFSILFSVVGGQGATNPGVFVNQVVQILDRMDFTCPLGSRLADGTCDQSFGSVAKSVISILGILDFSLITDQKTATFVKSFVSNFPTDVFSTGFSLAQMDRWVTLTSLVAEQLGVSEKDIKSFKEAYNNISKVLKQASKIIKEIDNILKYVQYILDGLGKLTVIGIEIIKPEILQQISDIVNNLRQLIVEIRKVTDSFDQLKEVQISWYDRAYVAYSGVEKSWLVVSIYSPYVGAPVVS